MRIVEGIQIGESGYTLVSLETKAFPPLVWQVSQSREMPVNPFADHEHAVVPHPLHARISASLPVLQYEGGPKTRALGFQGPSPLCCCQVIRTGPLTNSGLPVSALARHTPANSLQVIVVAALGTVK